MQSSRTRWLTVLICDCGARFADPDHDRAYRLLAAHQSGMGCGQSAARTVRRSGR